jgi:membrane-associated phospholipid phosphatase
MIHDNDRRRPGVGQGRAARLASRASTLSAVLLLALSGASPAVRAAGPAVAPSVPWMPDAATRHAVELLADDAGLALPILQWPLPRDAVAHALDALPDDLPPALDDARRRVRASLRRQQATLLTATVREHADALTGFGDDSTPGSSVELRGGLMTGPHVQMQLGARVDPRPDPAAAGQVLRLDDSAAVAGAAEVQVEAWAHRPWWGPGWQTALAMSNNTPALDGIGLQRSSAAASSPWWLKWLGPWSAEAFLARADGPQTPANPFIVGTRFEFRPFPALQLGLERTAQWGGQGHSQSLHSFANMLLSRHTNADTAAEVHEDPANEMAGYDARLRCPAGLRCAIYGQAIGEDMAGSLPSRFLSLGGMELWSADGVHRVFFEAARTSVYRDWFGPPLTGYAYRNYAYPSGYTNDGRWLGASAGPDSRLFTLGWIDADANSSVRVTAGHVGSRIGTFSPTTFDPASSGRLLGISARRTFAWGPATWTPEIDWNRVDAEQGRWQRTRVGLEMSLDLDDLSGGASSGLFDRLALAHPGWATQALAGAALVGGAAALDRPVDRYAAAHVHDTTSIALRRIGSGAPFLELGAAGAAWLASGDPRVAATGRTATESGLAALALAEAIKPIVDRERPGRGRGPGSFGHASNADASFPSAHTALAWGVLTPVAEEYDAPWLYGVAALTNAGRVLGRSHWLSDTVASSALGWAVGHALHARQSAAASPADASVALGPGTVAVSMPFK